MGRAGRPGFDTHGVAVIMTTDEDKEHFRNSSMDLVESNLQLHLIEIICAEISQHVIEDIGDALVWLKKTYFYIRVHKNPLLYGYEKASNEKQLETMLSNTCMHAIQQLADARIVGRCSLLYLTSRSNVYLEYSNDTFTVKPTLEATLMSRHMIRFRTMVLVLKLPLICTIEQLIKEVMSLFFLDDFVH